MKIRSGERGFTLIELLVVVAIIAILIAIMMPSLARARQQSRTVVCGSHQRSIGQAMMTYAGEFDGMLPYGVLEFGPQVGSNWKILSWDDLLNPYVGGNATQTQLESVANTTAMPIFTCPEDRFDRSAYYITFRTRSYSMVHVGDGSAPWYKEKALGVAQFSYPMSYGEANPNFKSYKLTEITAQATCLLAAEQLRGHNILGHKDSALIDRPFEQMRGESDSFSQPVHGDRFNYLFADGHVEALRPADTVRSPKNITSYQANYMWRRDGSF